MPLLDRLSATPEDDSDSNHRPPEGLSPIIPGRSGRPGYSLEALRERIERQLGEETANRPDILADLTTEDAQRELVREVADYVLGQDAIQLDHRVKADLIDHAYRNLFSYGPLDAGLLDPDAIEITATGPDTVHVRRRAQKPQPLQPAFDDARHFEVILDRLLAAGGMALSQAGPFAEVGAELKGRRARIAVAGPPVSPGYSLAIRLHPARPLTLDDLTNAPALMPSLALDVLRAILVAGRGLLIAGETGTGKTTLAGALAAALPSGVRVASVERAAEIRLPPSIASVAGGEFGSTLRAATEDRPEWLVIDEIRGDDSAALWDMLSRDDAPRLIGVFRATHRPDRLLSALSMTIRKAHPALDQRALVAALARHFPYVATLSAPGEVPHLVQIAALAIAPGGESLALEPVLAQQDGVWTLAPGAAGLPLDLPPTPKQ